MEPIQRARQRLREMAAAGIKPKPFTPTEKAKLNPKSKALALRAYYFDWVGLAFHNPGESKEMWAESKAICAEMTAERNYRGRVKAVCLGCAGSARLVRECRCPDCPLHKVRPYQKPPAKIDFTAEKAPVAIDTRAQPYRPCTPVAGRVT